MGLATLQKRVPDVLQDKLERTTPVRSSLLVFVLLLAVYLPSASYGLRVSTDTAMAAMPAWNLVEHGTLDLSAHRGFLEGRSVALPEAREVGDRLYSGRNPGPTLWALPFYALASPWTGAEPVPLWPAGIAAAVAAAAAVAVLHASFRRLVSPLEAFGAAMVMGLATTTWAVSADALWTHGPAQLGLAAAMLGLSSSRHAASGTAFGAALLARPYAAFAAAGAGLYLSWQERRLRPALGVGLATIPWVLAYLLYARLLFGRWSIVGGYYVFEDSYVSNVLGTRSGEGLLDRTLFHLSRFGRSLFDLDQGLFIYSLFLVLLVPGLVKAWRVALPWVRGAAVAGTAAFVAQVAVNGWWGGDFFFGNRYTLEALTLWSPLLLLAWREHVVPDRGRARLFAVIVVINIVWIGYGAVFEPYKG